MRILIADDEKVLTRAICKILEKNNYSVDTVYNGLDALSYMECGNYDAVILDLMMPGLDGISVLKKLRGDSNDVPVVILSARSEVEDKVVGLDSGANYYLTKPFDTKELLASLRAITRSATELDAKLSVGNIILDRKSFTVSSSSGAFRLAKSEEL
jgi:DNA-binding response OmpR family regulator